MYTVVVLWLLMPMGLWAQTENQTQYSFFLNPLTSLIGGSSFGLDVGCGKNTAFGVELSRYGIAAPLHADYIKAANQSYGLRLFWYENRVFQEGPFYIGKVIHLSSTVDIFNSVRIKSSKISDGYMEFMGYGSNWKLREFLVRLSGGATVSQVKSTEFLYNDGTSETGNEPTLGFFVDINLAYVF